jgi:hypothetical protein
MEIFPIAIFGSIEYYRLLLKSSSPLIDIHETYVKQSIRNRYQIGTANGILDLTIPISKPNGNKTKTHEIVLATQEKNWKINHWRAITSAYMHTPYFEHYENDIKVIFFGDEISLVKKSKEFIFFLENHLELNFNIQYSNSYIYPSVDQFDFRNKDFFDKTDSSKPYIQPFIEKQNFIANLSILDLLFCEGPLTRNYII